MNLPLRWGLKRETLSTIQAGLRQKVRDMVCFLCGSLLIFACSALQMAVNRRERRDMQRVAEKTAFATLLFVQSNSRVIKLNAACLEDLFLLVIDEK